MELPAPFEPRSRDYQREVARMLHEWQGDGTEPPFGHAEPEDLVAGCPDLDDHLRSAHRAGRLRNEIRRLESRLTRRRDDLVPTFDRLLGLLEEWGYVDGWMLTDRGKKLRWVYNELDILLTETAAEGILAGLTVPQMAAIVSVFTYEARRNDTIGGWPDETVAKRGAVVDEMWERLSREEDAAGLPMSRRPDPGFSEVAYLWASGVELDALFNDDFAAGDFVRNCRQLLDLLRQIRDAFPEVAEAAAGAVRAVDRGVVAVGGRV